MSKYTDLLKSPEWQKKRLKILERDNWTCKCCLSTERTLHVHHFFYAKSGLPWEVEHDSLLTVCESCHEIIEHAKSAGYHFLFSHLSDYDTDGHAYLDLFFDFQGGLSVGMYDISRGGEWNLLIMACESAIDRFKDAFNHIRDARK